MEETKSSNGIESIGLQGPTVNHDLNRGGETFHVTERKLTHDTKENRNNGNRQRQRIA